MAKADSLITEHIDIWTSAIKKRSSQGRGNNKKIELTGIKKLRELILELAVRGQLVPQDPNDEPAAVLLEKIAAEKAQLIKDKKIKKPKVLPEISEGEKPFGLPDGWLCTRLDDIGITFIGLTYSPKDLSDKGIPVLRSSNVQKGKIDLSDLVRVNKDVKENLIVDNGDLLICARNGSKALVGKTAMIKDLQEPMAFGAFMAIFKCSINAYIEVFLNSPVFRCMLEGVATTTINQITQSNLKSTIIFLPPLAEQHRIVAKVDELMALCDQLEQQTEDSITAHQTLVETLLATLTSSENTEAFNQSWARIAAHFDTLFTTEHSIDQLKQTVLQLAVMGKLVPQDPNNEPASVLLEKIAAEKEQLIKDKKIKKQKPLPAISDDEKPFELPCGWAWSRMGDLAQYQKGYAFKSKDYLDSGLMITKIQNLTDNHTQNSVFITPEKAVEFEQYLLIEGDIVMTTVGSWFSAPISAVGRSFLINNLFDNSLLNQNAVRIKSMKDLDPMYLYLCVNSTIFKNYLVKEAQGTANQASITQVSIKNYLICVPPKEEQHRIVKKVDELMALCDQLKAHLSEAQATQLQLADTIVEQAVN